MCENRNNRFLPRLPKHKNKEKWAEVEQKTELFVQRLRSPIYISTGSITIGDHALSYKGCHSHLIQKILLMLVRGIGITDISVIENVSIKKMLSVLVNSNRIVTPKQQHYDCLEVDEPRRARRSQFWTYVGNKK